MTIRSAAIPAVIILVLSSTWRIEASAAPSAIVYVDMSDNVPVTTRASEGETVRLVVYEGGCPASAFNSVPFDPTKVVGTPVGAASVTFADGNNAIIAYAVNGVAQTKSITREIISAPGTTCQ